MRGVLKKIQNIENQRSKSEIFDALDWFCSKSCKNYPVPERFFGVICGIF